MNPHPPLSGFPIVLLILLCGGEILWFCAPKTYQGPAVRIFLLVGTLLFVPLTYFSGDWGVDAANQAQIFKITTDQISFHQNTAKLLLLSVVPLLLFGLLKSSALYGRSITVRISYLISLALSLTLCILTSYRGGELVFTHGAAVTAEPKNAHAAKSL